MADGRLRNRSRAATFLCYHSVAGEGPRYLTVSPQLFESHLDSFSERGLQTGDLATLEALAAGERVAPTVFLTFDDGFRDNYETVLPLLRERGMRAFVFVLPPLVDDGAPLVWPEVAADAERFATMRSVTWEMLEEMKEGGFEVGAHTLTHPHLPDLEDEALEHELSESRQRVKTRLGSCDTLAYPFGEWSPRVEAAAKRCGYRFAFSLPTERGQRSADVLTIPRLNVDYRDSGRRLAAKLSPPGRAFYLSEATKAVRRAVRGLRGR
ncbi:MAG TPA: polysaccharide deacetylase family protein [Solirubrobacterales bacterium]|nr:polysaccharide deacetylase family protein [Solirubrobacterales bacterium]